MPDTVNVAISFEGRSRSYTLHKPAPLGGAAPKVVMVCHGGNGSGNGMWDTNWKPRWANKGVWMVFPDAEDHGIGTLWVSHGDDVPGGDDRQDERFLIAVIADVTTKAVAAGFGAPADWFMCGFSSGGKMTEHMYIFQATTFRSFGITSKALRESMAALTPVADKSTVFICGNQDTDNWAADPGQHIGALATVDWFRARHGCQSTFTEVLKGGNSGSSYIRTYNGCTLPTRSIEVDGAHAWFKKPGKGIWTDEEFMLFWKAFEGLNYA